MSKRGGSKGKVTRCNRSTGGSAETKRSGAKNESKSKQEKEFARNLAEEPKRKKNEKENSEIDIPIAMSMITKAATFKEVYKNGKQQTCDEKTIDKIARNAPLKNKLNVEKQKPIPVASIDVLKKENIGTDSFGIEKFSSNPRYSTEKAFLACAFPFNDAILSPMFSNLLQVMKKKVIEKQMRKIDPTALRVKKSLSSDNEKENETNSKKDDDLNKMHYCKDIGNRKMNVYQRVSKTKREFSSESEKKIYTEKLDMNEVTPMLRFSQNIGKKEMNFNRKTSKEQQHLSSKETNFEEDKSTTKALYSKGTEKQEFNFDLKYSKCQQKPVESKQMKTKTEGLKSTTAAQGSKDINEQKQKLDLKDSIEQHTLSSKEDRRIAETEFKEDLSKTMKHYSKDPEEQELSLKLKPSKFQQKPSLENKQMKTKTELLESTTTTHDSTDINEQKQNLDLKDSIEEHTLSSKDKRIVEIKYQGDQSKTMTQYFKDPEEQEVSLKLKPSKFQQKPSLENKQMETKTEGLESTTTAHVSTDINEQKQNLDLKDYIKQHTLSSKEDKRTAETKYEVDQCKNMTQYSKDTEEQELSLELKPSKFQQKLPLENRKMKTKGMESTTTARVSRDIEIKQNFDLKDSIEEHTLSSKEKRIDETNFKDNQSMTTTQHCNNTDEQELDFELKSTKFQQKLSIENKKNETKTEGLKFITTSQGSRDIIEKKQDLEVKVSKKQQKLSLENERKIDESNTIINEFKSILSSSKDTDEQKLNFNRKNTNLTQEISVENKKLSTLRKPNFDEFSFFLQDSNLIDINEGIQNMDLSASIPKETISSDNLNKLNDLKIKEHEKSLNTYRSFEYDSLGNKNALINNENRYIADKKQKMTFNISDRNIKLSFIDNNVCIFTQRGKINCFIKNDSVICSLTDANNLCEPSLEIPSSNELSFGKDSEVSKTLGRTNIIRTTKKDFFDQSEIMHKEHVSRNDSSSTLKNNQPMVPRLEVERQLRNITENFLENVTSFCDNFEKEFLNALTKEIYAQEIKAF